MHFARVFLPPTAAGEKGRQVGKAFRGGKKAVRADVVEWAASLSGTAELIAELDHARGSAACLDLVELAVDLDELSSALEDDRLEGGAINLESGEVWPAPALDHLAESGEEEPDLRDADVWLVVHASYRSRRGYLDMEAFIETIDDPAMVDRLSIAIDGKGAFRRFRSVLERDDDLVNRWIVFSEERRLGRARAWLAEAGYRPLVRPPLQSVE